MFSGTAPSQSPTSTTFGIVALTPTIRMPQPPADPADAPRSATVDRCFMRVTTASSVLPRPPASATRWISSTSSSRRRCRRNGPQRELMPRVIVSHFSGVVRMTFAATMMLKPSADVESPVSAATLSPNGAKRRSQSRRRSLHSALMGAR